MSTRIDRPASDTHTARGGRIVAQLMHAGALSQGNPHRRETKGDRKSVV